MAKSGKGTIGSNKKAVTQNKQNKEAFVIGIAASAGGLQALGNLFKSVPNDSVSYVIVQHLSSEHRSLLVELVAQQSVLEVVEAQHDMPVELNKVYVIPHNKVLTIGQSLLQLHDKSPNGRSRTVDTFFKSLAVDKGHRAIGIVLSGTGTDGTEGVIAIKKAGGMVLVQDPHTAKFDGMPRNAINTGYADYVLPPEAMPQEIFNIVKVMPVANEVTELISSETESSFLLILDMIHERTGIDFSNYKRPTVIRRISRRMALNNIVGLIDYLDYLHLHPEEIEVLSKDFLIGLTKFFRDKEAYEALAKEVIPAIIDQKDVGQQLCVWIAGCSTGEEAYSLAILIREYLDKAKKELEVKIFASDIDREALDYAGKGVYPANSMSEVSEERLHDFFVQEDGKYKIRQRVRRMVIFAPHNVVNDPPFSKVDLVSCRNMLIYLNPALQKKIIEKFHYALLMGGYLFLGSSESIGDTKKFREVNKKWKIYNNIEPAHAPGMDSIINSSPPKRSITTTAHLPSHDLPFKQLVQQNFSEFLNETLLDEYGYAAVYIDEHYNMLHGVGRFKNYLDLPEQNFTFNLLKLVSPDLASSLGTLLRKSVRDNEKVAAQGIPVREGESIRYLNVIVKPNLTDKKLYQKFILVVIGENRPSTTYTIDQDAFFSDGHHKARVHELELELQHTREDLQAVIEELETSNEELQSTNEELQSLNEELHTINIEHQYKIKALVELDNDLNNYFRSADIGQIFVDRKLLIRKYTPAATRLINLIESDIGRSIYKLSYNLRYDNLIKDVRYVITSNKVVEKKVQDKEGVWYQMCIQPYITQVGKIDGAIIIFIQINEVKNLQLLHVGVLNSSPNAIFALRSVRDSHKRIVDFSFSMANYKAQELFSRPLTGLVGHTLWEVFPQLLEHGIFEKLTQVVETGNSLDVELPLKNEQQQWLHLVAVNFDDGVVLTLQDVTEPKVSEETLKVQQDEIKNNAERFRTLLEAIPHITWTNLPSGENNKFNEVWYDYTGLSEDESRGWGWEVAFHPEDVKTTMPVFKECLETGQVLSVQARILHKFSNQYRWHLIKNVPIRNKDGQIVLWVGTATDIQDQKDAEEASIRMHLAQQREILNTVLETQETERARISEALHNGLGQLLYATKLHLDHLKLDNADVENILKHTNHLITQSINITRNISHELTPSILKDFGLKVSVEEMVSRFTSQHLNITSKLSDSLAQLEYSMALSLYRIVQELLNNIVKHSQATQASVKITLENNVLFARIQDNGTGKCNDLPDVSGGTGLRSVQSRVELLGGKLENLSTEGKGCTFEITFIL